MSVICLLIIFPRSVYFIYSANSLPCKGTKNTHPHNYNMYLLFIDWNLSYPLLLFLITWKSISFLFNVFTAFNVESSPSSEIITLLLLVSMRAPSFSPVSVSVSNFWSPHYIKVNCHRYSFCYCYGYGYCCSCESH